MAKGLVRSMLAAGLFASSAFGASAQDAAAGCSGFMCKIFGSRLDDQPAAAPASAAAQAVAAIPDPADPGAAGASPRQTAAKPAAKALPVVTIAADAAEAPRLRALASVLPGTRVHVVEGASARGAADFAVSPAVNGAASAEKARLFTEQLHIVTGKGVGSVADLAGKVVSFGPEGSPAQAAARKAFAALGVGVTETPLEVDNALDGIATGDVAAAVLLAPQPDPRLARLKAASGLHLLPWPAGTPLPDSLVASTIPAKAYPGLTPTGTAVATLGVAVALDANGRAAASPAAKVFLASLARHSASLSKRGFDLLVSDLAARAGSRVASADRR